MDTQWVLTNGWRPMMQRKRSLQISWIHRLHPETYLFVAGSWCCHLQLLVKYRGHSFPDHVIRQHKQDKMATLGRFGILFCLFHCCYSFGIFDDLLGDTDKCEDICSNTYPLHTYEKVSNSVSH